MSRGWKGARRKMCLTLSEETIAKLEEIMALQRYSLPGDVVEKAVEDLHGVLIARKSTLTAPRIRRES